MSDAVIHVPAPCGGVRKVSITHPNRELWSADEMPDGRCVTKAELAEYLLAVEPGLMQALADRPVTVQRFPGGISGEPFYAKRPPKGMPAWTRTAMCTYPSGRKHEQLVISEIADVVWLAQLSTITLHPWPVRAGLGRAGLKEGFAGDLDRPDELRIDLDPQPGTDFADAVNAAFALRELMIELGLTPWVKTSGNRGVHVFARVAPTAEFLQVRHAVIGIARELERRLPQLVTASWWKEERGERVFVDFNQACRDRTIAGAYSPRPLVGAPVSFPLSWPDLETAQPSDFTVRTVPGIVAERGHAWAAMDDAVGDLAPALALWQNQVDEGLGELNFPPDYPKMPGEPPRVQPSKRKADRADADYLAPKAERDAHWGVPVVPPFGPMLAKPLKHFPQPVHQGGPEVIYEPKWDGFRSLIWRSGDQVEIGSRNSKPMTRYFPELVTAILTTFPDPCVIDGEIVLVDPKLGDRLNFDALQQRIHPAASRVKTLAEQMPASFVAFDLLALGELNYTERPFAERRVALEQALAQAQPPIYLTPVTRDREQAQIWFTQFEGAGLDGVIAKPVDVLYLEDKRAMFKIKHERTADCVVAGYRTHTSGDDRIGSLLLGLYTDEGVLNSVGVIGAFPMARRQELFAELQPLVTDLADHPFSPRTGHRAGVTPAAHSRWNAGKDVSFVPLRPERVVEVRYDHMEGVRFRHTAQFVRWRDDRDPASCTYAQLDEVVSYDLAEVLAARG